MVTVDTAGRANPGVGADGFAAIGKASATTLNLTTDPSGGAADAEDQEVEYGVFGWRIDGATPLAGDVVFLVDNQTVSTSDSGGTRGVAGYVTEIRDDQGTTANAFVWMGPHVAGQIVIAAAEAAKVTTLQAEMLVEQTQTTSDQALLVIPMNAWRVDDGTSIPAFSDGVADGFSLVDSEAMALRLNDSIFDKFITNVVMPPDLDETADMVVHIQAARIGAADPTAVLTFEAFFNTVGSAHTADADAGSDSTAFDGATTVITEETMTIALADVPAQPGSLTLTMVADAALDADDLIILSTTIEYTRKALAS
jgi:hypothetical protein